ncbi:SDR family NAD(P)-dependent oxidoreductase [Paracoccus sp. 1_MG-2023]|uniref:SDR family oxidoreductase n=1 Tax=unclassified Paracoccus (in: a-proteobacteria) TaxID=2688777 RepID=UPI001C08AE0D|nr:MULTISPECIES: SDR family NAD(P)-dependent oxidoreductase [unclassified Paracoccus (in: a-proteobacteria)]MBU2957847.1 SDR family NAD(P)-dependent oxidoreductase [Paracoccus sp. C2R09]MDO6667305.1 SDR family NAD(P)-dependent oxidoreductase [Paracoccus sp. 1_MG-2023]
MNHSDDLKGRTILIAGASSGMGLATAIAAAQAGADLILLGRNADRMAEAAARVDDAGPGRVRQVLADAADADALARALEGQIDGVDMMVNTIGVNIVRRSFGDLTPTSWAGMIDANLNAAFNLAQILLPVLRARGGGLMVNISSTAARKPDASGAAYQATKAGVLAMTHAITEEEWQNGIRATVIMPGMTDTPLLAQRPTPPTDEMRARALQPQDVADACMFVMRLPPRAHVTELTIQPSQR